MLVSAGSQTILWFLPCIFAADMIYTLIACIKLKSDIITKAMKVTIIALCPYIGIMAQKVRPYCGFPFSIDCAMLVLPFFMLGEIYKKFVHLQVSRANKWLTGCIGLILFGLLFITYQYNLPESVTEGFNHVEMSIMSIGNMLVFFVNAVIGIGGVCCISEIISSKFLVHFGQVTLTCLLTHRYILSLARRVMQRMNIHYYSFGIYLLEIVIVIMVTFFAERVLSKFAPNLIGKNSEFKSNTE